MTHCGGTAAEHPVPVQAEGFESSAELGADSSCVRTDSFRRIGGNERNPLGAEESARWAFCPAVSLAHGAWLVWGAENTADHRTNLIAAKTIPCGRCRSCGCLVRADRTTRVRFCAAPVQLVVRVDFGANAMPCLRCGIQEGCDCCPDCGAPPVVDCDCSERGAS